MSDTSMADPAVSSPAPDGSRGEGRRRAGGFVTGAVIAALAFMCYEIVFRGGWDLAGPGVAIVALAGGLLGLTRWRWLVTTAGIVVVLQIAVPVAFVAMPGLVAHTVREDPLQAGDAVVFLSSDVTGAGRLDAYATERLLSALEVLHDGWAPVLVHTRLPADYRSPDEDFAGLLRLTGTTAAVEEVGPISNTHDEALKVAELASERGWTRVILVTSPTHSRRAAATFEAAGLAVVSRPCASRTYSLADYVRPRDSLYMLGAWAHEELGWMAYRMRGWVR
jgi:hypothetical protein